MAKRYGGRFVGHTDCGNRPGVASWFELTYPSISGPEAVTVATDGKRKRRSLARALRDLADLVEKHEPA